MNTWAVIKTGAKQYKVAEGSVVNIEKVESKGDSISFDQILLVVKDDKVEIGKPYLEKAKVKGKILETFKDKKVRVVKFKSKSRYLRTRGHRQILTRVLIEKIES